MTDIPKTYDPRQVETKWYQYWERHDLFKVDPASGRKPFCIIMPPPNVTGQLHMGHALQDSIQDMLIRMKRMQGFESHWQPGKDHAGIATQNVVEKQLAASGVTRQSLGREKFIERVWEWKERFGNRSLAQKRLLGDSADWSRERFTLDEGLTKAVALVFKKLYDKGLIYRGSYIVNWCPRCHTAISDEEVNHEDHDHHLWHFKYPFKDGSGFVTVATTRPETMLGDTAVAVNPSDERFKDLVGKIIVLPLVGREIPIIADEYVDPTFGTGQVKVTPAHDPNDFDMGVRHHLPRVLVIDEDGRMNENVPERFRGLDRFEARKEVLKALDELKLLVKTDDYKTSIGHCQRCHTVIEPYLSLQWFVKMKPLAEPALEAVRDGRITFYPARWGKVYFAWMENIRDWCISRQLWWGHRIPVYYCQGCGAVMVETEAPDCCPKCGSTSFQQDEDVLDTWFSSWLWAFSSLGWPEKSPDRDFWYPSDVMVTAYDIIFFWVSRMIMAGLEFMDDIPFRDVYITGMIKDEIGQKMSKSLGNGIDPAEMAEQYGADAVRFTLLSLASEGQDIKLAPSRFEGGRNFANKLWNSYRFLISQIDRLDPPLMIEDAFDLSAEDPLPDRWIVSRLRAVTEKVYDNAARYRVNDVVTGLYDFVWREYCDWYLELIKVRLAPEVPEEIRRKTLGLATAVFEAALRLLHPTVPFITEEMWHGLHPYFSGGFMNLRKWIDEEDGSEGFDATAESILFQPYPKPGSFPADATAESEMEFVQEIIGAVRVIRSEMQIPPERKGELILLKAEEAQRVLIEANAEDIQRLAGLNRIAFELDAPRPTGSAVVDNLELYLPLGSLIDLDVECKRLNKEILRLEGLILSAEAKLSNEAFVSKAPANIIEHERGRLEDCRMQLISVKRNREALD